MPGNQGLADLPILRVIPRNLAIRTLQLIFIMLTVLIAARLFWTLFAPLAYPETAPAIVPIDRDQPGIADRVTARNPFAMTGAPVNNVVIVQDDSLQETALDLVLHGVIVNGDRSSATIDVKNGDGQDSFAIGDSIVQGVTLEEVRFDAVVINRNGVREVLRMQNTTGFSEGGRRRGAPGSGNLSPADATSIRNRAGAAQPQAPSAQANPGTEAVSSSGQSGGVGIDLRDLVTFRIRPNDGEPALFLFPGRNRAVFAEVGLLPQDMLVSINGAPPPADLRRAYDSAERALESGTINLVIERDGSPRTIAIDIERLLSLDQDDDLTLPTGDEVEL